jgi:hypothetical protein
MLVYIAREFTVPTLNFAFRNESFTKRTHAPITTPQNCAGALRFNAAQYRSNAAG